MDNNTLRVTKAVVAIETARKAISEQLGLALRQTGGLETTEVCAIIKMADALTDAWRVAVPATHRGK